MISPSDFEVMARHSRPVEKVCHWLSQCWKCHDFTALAEPVAHTRQDATNGRGFIMIFDVSYVIAGQWVMPYDVPY